MNERMRPCNKESKNKRRRQQRELNTALLQ